VRGAKHIHSYDQTQIPLREEIEAILDVTPLEEIHKTELRTPEQRTNDQVSPAHGLYYKNFDRIRPLYKKLLREVIAPMFEGQLVVQRVPTFRMACPGSTAVSEFHTDAEYNHQPDTVNFWVPFTECFATNTVWIESAVGTEDYEPAVLSPGQFLQFDAIRLRHGNYANETGQTRLSFDFRVIPVDNFQSTGKSTVTQSTPMEIGSYYELLTDED
jgi:ectoine hydroxylase-related dioxygenase (phytanoyl-CoA dioxygenase family)